MSGSVGIHSGKGDSRTHQSNPRAFQAWCPPCVGASRPFGSKREDPGAGKGKCLKMRHRG